MLARVSAATAAATASAEALNLVGLTTTREPGSLPRCTMRLATAADASVCENGLTLTAIRTYIVVKSSIERTHQRHLASATAKQACSVHFDIGWQNRKSSSQSEAG
eukprot:13288-Heterococcus_DN1.PRE.3